MHEAIIETLDRFARASLDDLNVDLFDTTGMTNTNMGAERGLSLARHLLDRQKNTRVGLLEAYLKVRAGSHTLATNSLTVKQRLDLPAQARSAISSMPTQRQQAIERNERAAKQEQQAAAKAKRKEAQRQDLLEQLGGKYSSTARLQPGQLLSPKHADAPTTYKWTSDQIKQQLRLRNLDQERLYLYAQLTGVLTTSDTIKLSGNKSALLNRLEAILKAEQAAANQAPSPSGSSSLSSTTTSAKPTRKRKAASTAQCQPKRSKIA
jgi:hypothetical protein